MEMHDYPLRVMHGYRLATREAIDFCELLRKAKKLSELKGGAEISKARREVLPYGALVLERLLRRMQPKEVVFSVFGIREGLLYSLLSEAERRKDPLLAFAEDYARLRSRSAEHARELCAWTDALFSEPGPEGDATRSGGCGMPPACSPTSAGARIPTTAASRASTSSRTRRSAASTIQGRIFLALAVYFRHVGAGEDDEAARICRSA